MSVMTEKKAFPESSEYSKDGWTIQITYQGIFDKFHPYYAQEGDPKGAVVLTGPGVEIRLVAGVGSFGYDNPNKLPVNLSWGRGACRQLAKEIVAKYNRQPDYAFLHELCRNAFFPYDRYYLH